MSTQNNGEKRSRARISVRETVIFAMLGTLMFASKVIMEALPNIHLLGMLVITYTVVFRKKALIPIYIYVGLNGLYAGFSLWWIPYLYIWTVLWAATMLFPACMPKKRARIVYPTLCALHGILFGVLYAPAQAIIFRMSLQQTAAWIISGLPFDIIHGIGNFFVGMLILPLCEVLKKLTNKQHNGM